MNDWNKSFQHTWKIKGLPENPQTNEKTYSFYIGHLNYIIPEGRQNFYLTIPEIPNRDAEGRSLFPEQEDWVRNTIKILNIHTKEIWYSHWQFHSTNDAITFEKYLQEIGASLVK